MGATLQKAVEKGFGPFEVILIIVILIGIFYVAFIISTKNKKIAYYIYESPSIYFYPITIFIMFISQAYSDGGSNLLNFLAIPFSFAFLLRLIHSIFKG